MKYWTCKMCGANLDMGERCDCREKAERKRAQMEKFYKREPGSGQIAFNWNPERGKVS